MLPPLDRDPDREAQETGCERHFTSHGAQSLAGANLIASAKNALSRTKYLQQRGTCVATRTVGE
jgi:hypothetical protein